MTKLFHKQLLLGVSILFSAEVCADALSEIERWQALALADLEAAKARIMEAHPGAIDAERPDFHVWVHKGFEQARDHVKHVISYDTAVAAVRFYTSGFEDDHLIYSDDIRGDFPIWITGWRIERSNGNYLVATVVPDWQVALPPVGSIWTGCDGAPAEHVLRGRIGPFVNRGSGEAGLISQMAMLGMRLPVAKNLQECSFLTPEGDSLSLAISYHPVTVEQFVDSWPRAKAGGTSQGNSFDVGDGVLWARAGRFDMREKSSDLIELDRMLAGLETVQEVHTIVFDVRGNRGGDSGVGDRIFNAATGGLELDQNDLAELPPYYAEWRVSDYLLDYLSSSIEASKRLYGADSPRVRQEIEFRDSVMEAKAQGKLWVEQHAGKSITRADVVARHGRLRRFSGRVVLLTDGRCMSACLDFADTVLQVPNSIHIGQVTGADSVYMVGSLAKLPSGNRLSLPVKVWRNRTRGNNEALRPDVTIDLGQDEAKIRQAVLRALSVN